MRLLAICLILSSCNALKIITGAKTHFDDKFIESPYQIHIPNHPFGPSRDDSPLVEVYGAKAGDLVEVFLDPGCSIPVGQGSSDGVKASFTLSALPEGEHGLYATVSTISGVHSPCSAELARYHYLNCPSGFIAVPGSHLLGVSPFCVMKFEAKNDVGVASSQASIVPWTNVTRASADTECEALGANYDLISNPEWVSIAHSIELTEQNWSGGSVGIGMIPRGHSDSLPAMPKDISDPTNPYDNTGNSAGSGWEQKRTLMLLNGEEIWDFSGNVMEWVDWSLGGTLDDGVICGTLNEELNGDLSSCVGLVSADYQSLNGNFGSAQGFGLFRDQASGDAAVHRGGSFNSGTGAGVLAIQVQINPSSAFTNLGFRCVYRP